MIDVEQLKRQVNIVDIVGAFLPLKKQGKDYFACCPFHGEKTPSFSVSEDKQFYHCFGCGVQGDVIHFLQEYHGWEFFEVCKYLGADVDAQPVGKIRKNETRLVNRFKLPHDHKQLESNFDPDPDFDLPIVTIYGDIVNYHNLISGDFAAGGVSYNAAHLIRANDKPQALAVVDYKLGKRISLAHKINVMVCFTGAAMKYICKWNSGDWKIKPVIRACDDDYLCYEMPWLKWDGEKLNKMGVIE